MLKSSMKVALRQDTRQLACRVNIADNLACHLPVAVKVVGTIDLCLAANADQLQEHISTITKDWIVRASHQS